VEGPGVADTGAGSAVATFGSSGALISGAFAAGLAAVLRAAFFFGALAATFFAAFFLGAALAAFFFAATGFLRGARAAFFLGAAFLGWARTFLIRSTQDASTMLRFEATGIPSARSLRRTSRGSRPSFLAISWTRMVAISPL
jgi:hypothetical protein